MKEDILRIEKQKKFIIQFLYWGIIIGACILLGKYLIPVLVPFIIAFIIAGALNKPIQYISEKTRIKRKIVSVIVLLLFLFCSSIIVSYFCSLCFGIVERVVSFLPTLFESFIIPFTEQAFEKVEELFHHADLSVLDVLQANASTVLESMNHAVRESQCFLLPLILIKLWDLLKGRYRKQKRRLFQKQRAILSIPCPRLFCLMAQCWD